MIQITPKIILGSASPRRAELLRQIRVPFTTVVPRVIESVMDETLPARLVERLAHQKAVDVFRQGKHLSLPLIAADSLVTIDGDILGKPVDIPHACAMVTQLSGRTHTVMTGYTILSSTGETCASKVVETQVTLKRLSHREIAWYADTREGLDKSGGYAIQGIGAALVHRIEGSYTNVVGLPLCEVITDLAHLGIFSWVPM